LGRHPSHPVFRRPDPRCDHSQGRGGRTGDSSARPGRSRRLRPKRGGGRPDHPEDRAPSGVPARRSCPDHGPSGAAARRRIGRHGAGAYAGGDGQHGQSGGFQLRQGAAAEGAGGVRGRTARRPAGQADDPAAGESRREPDQTGPGNARPRGLSAMARLMGGKPNHKPERPWFSSGPTAKRPGWSSQAIRHELLGRGIRAPEVVARFAHGLDLTRDLLELPDDWRLVYVPGSDTGAVEAAMWSMLGERPVQALAFENFGQVWATDLRDHLKLEPEVLTASWGDFPDVSRVDPACDLVFPWNGTTSGVRAPGGDWISADREGLVICDATSAAFAMPLPWDRLDVVTFSFQKALGG